MADTFDRNFEKYMEGDQPSGEMEQPVNDLPYTSEDDDRTHLMNLLDYLEDELTRGRPVPLTNNRMLNAQMCIDIIGDIRANLPLAIQYSEQILRDQERILTSAEQTAANKLASAEVRANATVDDAQERANQIIADANAQADDIVRDAEVRARAMIDQNSIKLEAQREAADIIREAEAKEYEMKRRANEYCEKLLRDSEQTLQAAYDDIRRNRQALGQNAIDMR